ncbi:MAG: TonB-dependent receptor [Alphaproteobacteria bacterium]|nr:TonB-dependent receptor [Alphaproteobacteria bacterium]
MNFKSRLLLTSACGLLLSALSQTALAEKTADKAATQKTADKTVLENIVVTGTRLPNANLMGTSPVTTVSSEQIKLEGVMNSEEFLAKLPQVSAGIGATSTGNDAFGAAVVDLRGLGQNRTLVLIDGTRGAPFGFRNSVDINSIPAALVKRVEVLTGGASVVYGADAVVGVVNFIMNDKFEGLKATSNYKFSGKGGAEQYGGNIAFGSNIGGDRGHISGYIGYTKRGQLLAGQRSFSAVRLNDGGVPVTRYPSGGNFAGSLGSFSFTDAGKFTTTPQTGDFTAANTMIMPMQRFSGDVFFNYNITDGVEAYGRAMFSNSQIRSVLNPLSRRIKITVQSNNPFLTPDIRSMLDFGTSGQTSLTVRRSLTEFGHVTRNTNRTTYQLQFGLRGALGDNVNWNGYVQYGRSDEHHLITGEGLKARMTQAANATINGAGDPVCADGSGGCAPVNLFGPNSMSQKAVDFISVPLSRNRSHRQLVAAMVLTGDSTDLFSLPAGPVSWVAGTEYRNEKADEINDSAIATGQTFTQGKRPAIIGGFNVKEVYGELRVPLLKDITFIKDLSVDGAYRYSDYSTSGGKNSWKVGGSWAVNDSIRFRGSYQSTVRAPNVGELFGPIASIPLSIFVNSTNTGRLVDPCSNPAVTGASTTQCAALGAPAAPYITNVGNAEFIFGGNQKLKPETGNTLTLGAVITPSAVPGLTLSVDYFNIVINGGLFVIFPWDAARNCYIDNPTPGNPLCALVPRGTNGQISLGDVRDRNVSSFKIRGIDIAASYHVDLPDSLPGDTLDFSYKGTIVTQQTKRNSQFTNIVDCKASFASACSIDTRVQAAYRHFVTATWHDDNVNVQLSWRMIGGVNDPNGGDVKHIAAQNYFNLAAIWDVNETFSIRAGIDNLFDHMPPLVGTNQQAFNTFPATYNVIGRSFGLSLTMKR